MKLIFNNKSAYHYSKRGMVGRTYKFYKKDKWIYKNGINYQL